MLDHKRTSLMLCVLSQALAIEAVSVRAADPPAGFVSLFNEEDLTGWSGRPHFNPVEYRRMDEAERNAMQAEWDADLAKHWRVENGEIVNDGHGVFCTTDEEFGDFELLLEWKMTKSGTDSGIYLRGCPQVQIWDPDHEPQWAHGARLGSCGLWNNNPGAPGKDPLTRADKPVGEWNKLRVLMKGDQVTVHLNGQLVVDHAVMHNFWDRKAKLYERGPIQLQTHGGEMRFRNLFVRRIDENPQGVKEAEAGWKALFDGRSLEGWIGAVNGYEVRDGALCCRVGAGGNLFTKDEYSDFVLRFEFLLSAGANNGLGIRSPLQGDPAYVGIELQVLDNTAEQYANLRSYQYHGSAYGVAPAKRGFLKPVGQWNEQEVRCVGSEITVVLNGEEILDVDLAEAAPAGKTIDGREHPGLERSSGHIGLLGHGSDVRFRNLRLLEISDKNRQN